MPQRRLPSSNTYKKLGKTNAGFLLSMFLIIISPISCKGGFIARSKASLQRAVAECFKGLPIFCSIADWDVSKVKDMSGMFQGAAVFNGDISGWRVSNVETMKDMFRDAKSFKQTLHGNTWGSSGAIKTGMFQGSHGEISTLIITGSNDIGPPKIRTTTMYPGHKILSKEHLKKELTIYLNRSPEGHCLSCPQGAVGTWDVSRVTDMSGLFESAFLFNADISNWDVSRVTDMRRMFKGAKSFDCDLSSWDVSRVTDMSQMFSGAKSFKGDTTKWQVSTEPPVKVVQSESTLWKTVTATQWFMYGKKHFTKTGWQKHSAKYPKPDLLTTVDLTGRVFVVTGANSGIGKELTKYLSSKKAKVYMICRNNERAEKAKTEILQAHKDKGLDIPVENLQPLIYDCSLVSDMLRLGKDIEQREPNGIDGLVCNAGALDKRLNRTPEGFETTFACHLLCGSYGITQALEMSLRRSAIKERNPRVIFVSSGGMYNTKFPEWGLATADALTNKEKSDKPKFDGMKAYTYVKRGQVLLADYLAQKESKYENKDSQITYVSCHPGWTATPGVDAGLPDMKSYLKPMRDVWEGTEGIAWLAVAPKDKLQPGAFYLDRSVVTQHIAGVFFTEGKYTKNTKEELQDMIERLEKAFASKSAEFEGHERSLGDAEL